MMNFIHAHLPELFTGGTLVAMFGYVIYANIAYDREKKQEAQRRNTDLIHPTCKYHNLNKGETLGDKLLDALFGVAECVFKAATEQPTK
jgi:hypothetical protein